jgi:uncharacterized membrane protein
MNPPEANEDKDCSMRRHHTLTGEHRKLLKERQLARCRNPALAKVVERNIETIAAHHREVDESRDFQERIADFFTRLTGSMAFVYFHAILFVLWIGANLGIGGWTAFDPFPFGMLTTIVSLEAIFLSTFVLISQNRQALMAERQSELDLQINLLAEYEVTRILTLVDQMAQQLKVNHCDNGELADLEKDVEPEELLEELDAQAEKNHRRGPSPDRHKV